MVWANLLLRSLALTRVRATAKRGASMGPASGEDEGPDEQPGTASTSNDHADEEDHGGDDDHAGDNGDADDADEAVLLEANGCPSGFEALRAGFVAGHADRLVRSNSYVPLLCSYRAVT